MSSRNALRSSDAKLSAYDAYAEKIEEKEAKEVTAATVALDGWGTWDGRASMGSWCRIRRSRESGHQSRMVMGFFCMESCLLLMEVFW